MPVLLFLRALCVFVVGIAVVIANGVREASVVQLSVQIEGAQGLTWPIWQRLVRDVEALGFTGLYCCDHFANAAPPDYDSLEVMTAMTWAASNSQRIELGTLVCPVSWRDPVMLARRLSTLDFLSGGRVIVGLGLGWSKDEMEATGADMTKRGAMADEFIQVLKTIWTTNPVEFRGKFYNIPKSYINPKPVQKPHPPIYMGAFVPAALKRLTREADGWNPVFLPIPVMSQMFDSIKQMAKEAGRDPSTLGMIVRAIVELTDKPLGNERAIFSGSFEQITDDVRGCAKIGASEVFFDPAFSPGGQSLDRWLSLLDRLKGMKDVS